MIAAPLAVAGGTGVIWLYVFLVIAGILNTVQAGSNSTLQKFSHHPIFPGVVSFATGLLALGILWSIYSLTSKTSGPSASDLARAPWWAWIGGVLGCVYVLAMVNVSTKVGAGVFTAITVTTGVVTSLVMDHFALLGFAQHRASLLRIGGAVLMLAGVTMIGKG